MKNINHKQMALDSPERGRFCLSDKHYLELKRRDELIVSWLKVIADKVGVSIDISQLEKVN